MILMDKILLLMEQVFGLQLDSHLEVTGKRIMYKYH